MWGLMVLLGLQTAAAECRFDAGARDAPLSTHAQAAGVVIVEMRLTGQAPPPTAILEELSKRGIHATVLASASWASRHGSALARFGEAGHEIGYWAALREDLHLSNSLATPPDLGAWVSGLRQGRKTVQRAAGTKIRTIGISTLPNIAEKAIEGLGFRVILPAERTVGDQPRRSASLHSAAGRARIIGEGPYVDGCGALLPSWTPAALDRATEVATRGPWVRVVLPSDPAAAPLLARWLDEVVVAHKWTVLTASVAGRRSKPTLGRLTVGTPKAVKPAMTRAVDASTWSQVATVLAKAKTLPRDLPGGLNPTEAFLGLTHILASKSPPGTVTLGALRAPSETARTGLGTTRLNLTPEAVRHAAREIAPGLTGHVPNLIALGSHSLTAAEFLRVMALVYLERPPEAQAVTDPDPFASDGGWGESRGF